jgi:hypothetical protein
MIARRDVLLPLVVAAVAIVAATLALAACFSKTELSRLQSGRLYSSPVEGMLDRISDDYEGIDRVEVISAEREYFDDLWFVVANVWAERRLDGGGFRDREYDNPGCFFLKVNGGWAFVPEGKAEVVAFGKHLMRLKG